MRHIKKRICLLLTFSMLFTALFSGTVFAEPENNGTWKKNKKGWWYEYEDGTYITNDWLKDKGKWYYFLEDGYMEKEGYREGYWISKSGVMSTKYKGGRWKKDKTGWYYIDRTGWYPKNQWLKIDGKWYFFNIKGYLLVNEWHDGYCLGSDGAWIRDASTEWAKAYADFIRENYYNSTETRAYFDTLSFDLIYLDDDSTPEILVRYNDFGYENDILSYSDGKILHLMGLGKDGDLFFLEHTGLYYMTYGRQGVYSDEVCRLEKGKSTTIHEGSRIAKDMTFTEYDYTWDEKTVTKEQYEELVKTSFDHDHAQNADYQSYYAYDDMMSLLQSFNPEIIP